MCDLSGRALVFASGEPSGLSLTLPPVLDQLTAARKATAAGGGSSSPDRPVVVFDRGGSYPKTFKAVHDAGYDWISWRHAPLAATGMLPVCATIRQYEQDRHIAFTDEVIQLDGYPHPVRQVSLFEHGQIAAQLLTSCPGLCAGALLGLLRARWIIENFLKYNAANYGIDTLADYTADLADDTRLTANPAYAEAKKAAQADAQDHLAAMPADPGITARAKNPALIPAASKKITACERDLAAKAEQHLADHLNVYLHDDDEYRAITRETILRGLGGTIAYTLRAAALAASTSRNTSRSPKICTVSASRPAVARTARMSATMSRTCAVPYGVT